MSALRFIADPLTMNGFSASSGLEWTQLIKRTLALFGSAKSSSGSDWYRRCTPFSAKARYPPATIKKIAVPIHSSVSILD